MNEEKIICPKCDSDLMSHIGQDKSLMPRLIEDRYLGIGDFYQEIHVLQCGNCGCRFLRIEPVGFIKSITTESKPNQKKKYQVGAVGYKSFEKVSGTEKLHAVDNALNGVKEEVEVQEEPESKKPKKRKNDK